jgi:hypothetical protein
MNKIKKLQEQRLRLNGVVYKPYLVGNLPPSFGFKYNDKDGEDQDGIYQWFNFKGLTYVQA